MQKTKKIMQMIGKAVLIWYKKDGGNEGDYNIHSQSWGNGPSRGQSLRANEFHLSNLPMDP